MWIVGDDGGELLNTDNVFSFRLRPTEPNGQGLWAFGQQFNTCLVNNTQAKCEQALEAIRKALNTAPKERRNLLDLRDVCGQRPAVAPVEHRLIVPGNGEGPQGGNPQ